MSILKRLDPQSSPLALFGSELRAIRTRRGMSLRELGKAVHVGPNLLGKIEKAERRPQPYLVSGLEDALECRGVLRRLAEEIYADSRTIPEATFSTSLTDENVLATLRESVDSARIGDHELRGVSEVVNVLNGAQIAERFVGRIAPSFRESLCTTIGEAYQLAGWISFDHGRPLRAETLLSRSRSWADRANNSSLNAFVLGPNLSFVATYGGQPALGLERAYGAIAWARRSGNHRLVAFTMAIGARAYARLGEATLCLKLLDKARFELERHIDTDDAAWLGVFDHAAIDGHWGSCLLDLGQPDHALIQLNRQSCAASDAFVRNRVIWQIDGVEAWLHLGEIERACQEFEMALKMAGDQAMIPSRVLRRFLAIGVRLRELPAQAVIGDALERLHRFSVARV